jgi:hypothetical protein
MSIAACTEVDECAYDVPFSIDRTMNQPEAIRLRTKLRVPTIEGMCELVCRTLQDEEPSPGAGSSRAWVTSIDGCNLVVPTDAGEPGSIRCSGTLKVCPLKK